MEAAVERASEPPLLLGGLRGVAGGESSQVPMESVRGEGLLRAGWVCG